MRSNVYDDNKDFEVGAFNQNHKHLNIFRTRHYSFFFQIKKLIHYTKVCNMVKNNFIAEQNKDKNQRTLTSSFKRFEKVLEFLLSNKDPKILLHGFIRIHNCFTKLN